MFFELTNQSILNFPVLLLREKFKIVIQRVIDREYIELIYP